MTNATRAREAAAAAEQEAQEAAALATELEQRVASGDESISAENLDAQHRLSRWAQLRAEGAARKHKQALAADAVAAARAAIDQVAGIATSDAELVAAWTAAVEALRGLSRLAVQRTALIHANSDLLEKHTQKVRRVAGVDMASLGALPSQWANEKGYRLPDHGINVSGVPAERVVAAAVEAGVSGTIDPAQMALSRHNQLAGSTLTCRISGWDQAARDAEAAS